jgi:formylglycine-generating enzyme required for sulfatase activity
MEIMVGQLRKTGEALSSPTGMVRIPAGEFIMGDDEGDAEGPAHAVFLDEYWIDANPVTNQEFARFIEATGFITTATMAGKQDWTTHAYPGRESHPVVLVSWTDAEAYAIWAGSKLPTEAQWEKAARGGLVGKRFPWGDDMPSENRVNWNRTYVSGELPTSPITTFPPNALGVYDMAGNVWEWCHDWYSDDTYSAEPRRDPAGPAAGTYKARRGASWNVREAFRLRCANRGAMPPDSYHPNLGFRCVRV